eukprot:353282-Chlamydomonas_euryale.AAC.4
MTCTGVATGRAGVLEAAVRAGRVAATGRASECVATARRQAGDAMDVLIQGHACSACTAHTACTANSAHPSTEEDPRGPSAVWTRAWSGQRKACAGCSPAFGRQVAVGDGRAAAARVDRGSAGAALG